MRNGKNSEARSSLLHFHVKIYATSLKAITNLGKCEARLVLFRDRGMVIDCLILFNISNLWRYKKKSWTFLYRCLLQYARTRGIAIKQTFFTSSNECKCLGWPEDFLKFLCAVPGRSSNDRLKHSPWCFERARKTFWFAAANEKGNETLKPIGSNFKSRITCQSSNMFSFCLRNVLSKCSLVLFFYRPSWVYKLMSSVSVIDMARLKHFSCMNDLQ